MAGTGSVRGDGEDARRRQLIEATIESLADVGFAACTLMDIARRAGVSPGLVAHYFGDKDGLLEATLRHMAGRISRLVSHRLAEAPSPRARVQAVIDANLAPEEFDRRTASVWLAFWGQVIHSTRFRRVQNVYQSRMLSNLRHALRLMVPEPDVAPLAVTIAAIIDGLWLRETLVAEGEQQGAGARAIATALVDAELAAIGTRARPEPDMAFGGADRVVGQHIGGRVVAGGGRARRPAINPASGAALAEVELAGPADVEAAVEAASRGQALWAATGGAERAGVLRRIAERLRQQAQAMARLETAETGRPIRYTLADMVEAADGFERFAALAVLPRAGVTLDLGPGRWGTRRPVPVGVMASLGAAARPVHAAVFQLAPALAAGNALILKSSERTPLSAARLAALSSEAGLPPGLFNVLHGPDECGRVLVAHPDVATVSPAAVRPGDATLLIFADADLDAAVAATCDLAFRGGASVFAGGCHVLVQHAVRTDFLDRLVAAAGAIVTGDPLDPQTECGILAVSHDREETRAAVAQACAAGARLLAHGLPVGADLGRSFAPMILDLPVGTATLPEGRHAGVVTVAGFDDGVDAIRRVDRSVADGSLFVFTRDAGRGRQVADRLGAASCWVNFRGPPHPGFGCAPDAELMASCTRTTSLYVDDAPGG
jgi:betaine-aldehyde dehydrogenase